MATLADSIYEMAKLTAQIKREFKLNENTILNIINLNMQAQAQHKSFPDVPEDDTIPMPSDEELAETLGIPETEEETNDQ